MTLLASASGAAGTIDPPETVSSKSGSVPFLRFGHRPDTDAVGRWHKGGRSKSASKVVESVDKEWSLGFKRSLTGDGSERSSRYPVQLRDNVNYWREFQWWVGSRRPLSPRVRHRPRTDIPPVEAASHCVNATWFYGRRFGQ
ncbi:hypothetical protein K0M31_015948 [Melipona bicolor]|uniref:Uncharacterized protein n=1 Tax=Melipona bicolor TaxID=60889 RepID=A0AA40KT20_9HYME|nr:hypothetical protein K0M31_015948 [Melipona bicolor]